MVPRAKQRVEAKARARLRVKGVRLVWMRSAMGPMHTVGLETLMIESSLFFRFPWFFHLEFGVLGSMFLHV